MHSISNILIANRGEIVRRIIHTARKMGISTVAVYTEEEKNAPYIQEADNSNSLGSGTLAETYLNIQLIITIARENNCDAIHPGYGFLSENAAFAKACKAAGIIFIGPSAEAIQLMGNKNEARNFVQNLGISIPFSISGDNYYEISEKINQLQFPVIIKAAAGGGGKGMKIVRSQNQLYEAWESAQREAFSYFADAEVYLEKYIENARHVEVQIFGDSRGNVIHLFDRECTIQRRHQKIIEEAPAIFLPEGVRKKMLDTAVFIAKSMNYTNAGTIEFIVDKDLNFYFLEMNTRIQVEHPVTEAITRIDLVKEQINIAQGNPLSFSQTDITSKGHAIECRIYAEDPFSGFMPSAGKMLLNYFPEQPDIRIDSAFDGPAMVSSSFDPLIAKITVNASTRNQAIHSLLSYLKKCAVHGIKTNLEYLIEILKEDDFGKNNISTAYCESKAEYLEVNFKKRKKLFSAEWIIAASLAFDFKPVANSESSCIWRSLGAWRNIGIRIYSMNNLQYLVNYKLFGQNRIQFNIEGSSYLISRIENQGASISFHLNNYNVTSLVSEDKDGKIYITIESLNFEMTRADLPDISKFSLNGKANVHLSGGNIVSPLNGRIIQLNVKEGDKVRKGEILMIIESMKMENKILAPDEAVVSEISVAKGDQVIGSDLLIKLTMLN